jgi:hypothetical protein
MVRLIYISLIALTLIISSCESRRSKLDRRHLIPEKELVPILTDIYLTDGLVGTPRVVIKYTLPDSISTYSKVIEKHGYTREDMDKTMKYYFIKNQKRLIIIYDKVLAKLSILESRLQKELARTRARAGNLWPGLETYSFPDPSGTDSAVFDITLKQPGFYTLTADVTLFPDDQSLNPRLDAFTCNPDSIETGKRVYSEPVNYIKDGHEHKYIMVFSVPLKTVLHVRGSLYDFDNCPDDWGKHIVIQNISVVHSLLEL